jgi:hypothetical protein
MSTKLDVIKIVESIAGTKLSITDRISKRHDKGIFLYFNDYVFDDGEIDTIINDLEIYFKPFGITHGFMDNKPNTFDVFLQGDDDDNYLTINLK